MGGRIAGSDSGIDLGTPEHIVAHREFWPKRLLHFNKRTHRHGVLVDIRDVEQTEIFDIGAVFAISLDVDLPLEAEAVEVIYKITAKEGLNRLIGLIETDSLDHRLSLIHLKLDLWNIPKRSGEKIRQLGTFAGRFHELLRVGGDKGHRTA